jgi:prepilin-type processing-associated H-X9-DG protein
LVGPSFRPHDPNPATAEKVRVSYYLNSNLVSQGPAGAALSALNSPSSSVMLGECTGAANKVTINTGVTTSHPTDAAGDGYDPLFSGGIGAVYATGTLGAGQYATPVYQASNARHNVGANWLLCDGHVKFFRGEFVSPGRNADGRPCQSTLNGVCWEWWVGYGYAVDNLGKYRATFSIN